jgi:arsenite-transporting ATPase
VSNQARLILLSGTGGSGTSALVGASLAAAHDEGLRAVSVDATSPVIHASTTDDVRSLARALVGWLAADAVPDEAWTDVAWVRQFAGWAQVISALEKPHVDLVLVDCGSLREARALIAFIGTTRRLLDAAVTPTLAMRSPSSADDSVGDGLDFDVIQRLGEQLLRYGRLVESDRTTMRLVTVPEEVAVTSTLAAQAAFALLGVQVEAIIVNRFARKAEEPGRAMLTAQQAQLDRVEQSAAGSWVWKSTSALRPIPKDRSVIGPLGGVSVLRPDDLELVVEDEQYSVLLPLVGDAARTARVGRSGDNLVLEFDGLHRWLPLPAVLRRCRAQDATRTAGGLVLSFVPDESLWRTSPDPQQAA